MGVFKQNQKPDMGPISQHKPLNENEFTVSPGFCRRMIIIDGSNALFAGKYTGDRIRDIKILSDKLTAFSILIMVYKLLKCGFEVIVVIKKYFEQRANVEHHFILEELMKLELVRFVEDGMDDDAMVLNSAEHYGAAVISNDNFSQSKYIVYKEARRRVIKYCFKRTTIPPDEYYKPENIVDMFTNLTFLDFEKHALIPEKDETFDSVQNLQNQVVGSGYIRDSLDLVRVLSEWLQLEFCESGNHRKPIFPYFKSDRKSCPLMFSDFHKYYTQHCQKLARHGR